MKEKHSEFSRRKFLSTAATGLVSAGLVGVAPGIALAQEAKEKTEKAASKELIFRTLGKTKLKVPIISMGVMNANNPGIVQQAYEMGVRHFDTAANYAYGRNEQMVGNVLNKLGVRDKVIIGTKIYIPEQRVDDPAAAKKKLKELTDASLKRLKTDYADIMYVHSVSDPAVAKNEATMEAFAELKEEGKIRFTGITTHRRMAEVINAAVETGFYDVVLTSWNFALGSDPALVAAIENAAKNGVGIVAMKTQAGGQRLPNPESLQNYSSATINIAALKWAMQNENVITSIPGFDNFEHLEQDFSVASNLEFSDDERKFLGDNEIILGMGFCRQCEKCLASCPNNVDVPTLMRTHMYATQYANSVHARITLDEIPKRMGLAACSSCESCVAKCANSVDIAHRIDELKMIYA